MYLKGYCVDDRLLRTGAANFSRSGETRQDTEFPIRDRTVPRSGDTEFNAIARVVHSDREPQLAAAVKALFDTKYGWSDGLIAELTPE
jgi:hypothetical protein